MTHTNARIDDDLTARSHRELEPLISQPQHRVAGCGQLPLKSVLTADLDEAFFAAVRERLAEPMRVRVSLDDL